MNKDMGEFKVMNMNITLKIVIFWIWIWKKNE